MYVDLPFQDMSAECAAEITSVLRRICVGSDSGCWRDQPDKIEVTRWLPGGTGGSEVLEAMVRCHNHQRRQVIKIGQPDNMAGEWGAYKRHLAQASAVFAPIRAATPGVLDRSRARAGQREAVVYDNAAQFFGKPNAVVRTFEEVTAEGLAGGGEGLDVVSDGLAALFEGARTDLYDRYDVLPTDESLEDDMNIRMGAALVIEVDALQQDPMRLVLAGRASSRPAEVLRFGNELLDASVDVDAPIRPGDSVYLSEVKAEWRGDRLFATPCEDQRVQVQLIGVAAKIVDIAAGIEHDTVFEVHGRVRSTRARTHRDRLRTDGTGLRFERLIAGEGAEVSDPFPVLRRVLTERLPGRVHSTVHGDMNARNGLLVEDRPCLIDFADTSDGLPLYLDFARLEGSLVRGALSPLAWSDQVLLQRLLAAACRDESVATHVLAAGHQDRRLQAVFRLLWTIRRAARSVRPPEAGQPWWREYLVHLFLYAHLTLKWDTQTPAALRATAAMAGVAAELLAEGSV